MWNTFSNYTCHNDHLPNASHVPHAINSNLNTSRAKSNFERNCFLSYLSLCFFRGTPNGNIPGGVFVFYYIIRKRKIDIYL